MEIQLSNDWENIVGKGEIARYEQLLLFPQCFQKLSTHESCILHMKAVFYERFIRSEVQMRGAFSIPKSYCLDFDLC